MTRNNRLWSLWDMFKVNAHEFHKAIVILQQTVHFVAAGSQERMAQTRMSANDKVVTRKQIINLKSNIEALCCPVSAMAADDIIEQLNADNFTFDAYGQMAIALSNTFKNELTLKSLHIIDPLKAHFYESKEPLFNQDVSVKFSSINYEIDQAAKCYACDLTTASAFHSLRCLEAGIRAIARCLGIPDPVTGKDRNWGNVKKTISDEIERRWPVKTGRMSGDAQWFDEIFGALAAIQNPYRNATMHLDAVYTAPDAIHLFEVVKGLMVKIALRMDENGLPLA